MTLITLIPAAEGGRNRSATPAVRPALGSSKEPCGTFSASWCRKLLVVAIVQAILLPPRGANGQEIVPPGDVPTAPLTQICMPPYTSDGGLCAAFFVDEFGYEICLIDDADGSMRCLATDYGAPPPSSDDWLEGFEEFLDDGRPMPMPARGAISA